MKEDKKKDQNNSKGDPRKSNVSNNININIERKYMNDITKSANTVVTKLQNIK